MIAKFKELIYILIYFGAFTCSSIVCQIGTGCKGGHYYSKNCVPSGTNGLFRCFCLPEDKTSWQAANTECRSYYNETGGLAIDDGPVVHGILARLVFEKGTDAWIGAETKASYWNWAATIENRDSRPILYQGCFTTNRGQIDDIKQFFTYRNEPRTRCKEHCMGYRYFSLRHGTVFHLWCACGEIFEKRSSPLCRYCGGAQCGPDKNSDTKAIYSVDADLYDDWKAGHPRGILPIIPGQPLCLAFRFVYSGGAWDSPSCSTKFNNLVCVRDPGDDKVCSGDEHLGTETQLCYKHHMYYGGYTQKAAVVKCEGQNKSLVSATSDGVKKDLDDLFGSVGTRTMWTAGTTLRWRWITEAEVRYPQYWQGNREHPTYPRECMLLDVHGKWQTEDCNNTKIVDESSILTTVSTPAILPTSSGTKTTSPAGTKTTNHAQTTEKEEEETYSHNPVVTKTPDVVTPIDTPTPSTMRVVGESVPSSGLAAPIGGAVGGILLLLLIVLIILFYMRRRGKIKKNKGNSDHTYENAEQNCQNQSFEGNIEYCSMGNVLTEEVIEDRMENRNDLTHVGTINAEGNVETRPNLTSKPYEKLCKGNEAAEFSHIYQKLNDDQTRVSDTSQGAMKTGNFRGDPPRKTGPLQSHTGPQKADNAQNKPRPNSSAYEELHVNDGASEAAETSHIYRKLNDDLKRASQAPRGATNTGNVICNTLEKARPLQGHTGLWEAETLQIDAKPNSTIGPYEELQVHNDSSDAAESAHLYQKLNTGQTRVSDTPKGNKDDDYENDKWDLLAKIGPIKSLVSCTDKAPATKSNAIESEMIANIPKPSGSGMYEEITPHCNAC